MMKKIKIKIGIGMFFLSLLLLIFYGIQVEGGNNPTSLKNLNIQSFEDPQIMNVFIKDRAAAIKLGKALFWDMQVGSDGVQACASCHFHAGADNRRKNQLSPGLLGGDTAFGNSPHFGTLNFPNFRPNYTLQGADFPLHDRAGAGQIAPVTRDTNDVVSSMGVLFSQFVDIVPGSAIDSKTPLTDNAFHRSGVQTRRVEPRNTPSAINAVLFFDNFWDGRARNIFNGVNPFGELDLDSRVLNNVTGTLTPVTVRIFNSSLASQAVGPPLSDFEMSASGRTFPKLGKKMLSLVPLGRQTVHPTDSVLGPIANSFITPGAKGLNATYENMIKAAFKDEWWNSPDIVTFAFAPFHAPGRDNPRGFIINPGNPVISANPGGQLSTSQFTQMEANFSLFFGLAVQLYESTLVSDDTPFDQFAIDPLQRFLTERQQRGLAVFTGKGKCTECHGGVAFSNASLPHILGREPGAAPDPDAGQIELMNMAVGTAFYDAGFYNISVRPTLEDIGRGGTAPTINPLTTQPYPLSYSRLAILKRDLMLPPEVAVFIPNLPPGNTSPLDRTAVDGATKTSTLRNIELTGPFFRNGGAMTLEQVVEFYDRGGNFPVNNIDDLDPDIEELGFTPDEEADLVDFLRGGLTDNRVRVESTPFDHPQLFIPFGHDEARPGLPDLLVEIPAVGAAGRVAQGLPPIQPFLESFVIAGRVLNNSGNPIVGVTVTLTGGRQTITLADGSYSFTGVLNGSYTITPSLAGFIFLPASTNVTVNNDDLLNENFIGLQAIYSISGTVRTAGLGGGLGAPVAGVTITLSGAAARTATTDANGFYIFTALANGNYTVTPSQAGFAFTLVNRAVQINNANVIGQDFVRTAAASTFSISGTVRTAGGGGPGGGLGAPVAGVTITLSGAAARTATTDANGNYTFAGLANGGYTVTPSRAGFAFTPVNRAVTINNANVIGQNFTATASAATFSISGRVSATGGAPISGLTMTLSGAGAGTTTTDASGNYTFAGLVNGGYTVTPSLAGFTFAPVNRAVTINNANVIGQDFVGTAAAGTFSISGTVRARVVGVGAGAPVQGVTITLSGAASGTATTDANGNYTFTGLSNGGYTVIPSQAGRTFVPPGRAVTINNANVSGQNFTRN